MVVYSRSVGVQKLLIIIIFCIASVTNKISGHQRLGLFLVIRIISIEKVGFEVFFECIVFSDFPQFCWKIVPQRWTGAVLGFFLSLIRFIKYNGT